MPPAGKNWEKKGIRGGLFRFTVTITVSSGPPPAHDVGVPPAGRQVNWKSDMLGHGTPIAIMLLQKTL